MAPISMPDLRGFNILRQPRNSSGVLQTLKGLRMQPSPRNFCVQSMSAGKG